MALSAMQIQAIVDATKTPTHEQVRVIEAPRRPLLVVAGAGSGKTETMSMRVLWLLANHPDLSPSSILGLTFTRKAAGELGERLRERIRLLSREMPQLRERLDEDPVSLTYNSFAERIVSEHGMRIGIDPDFSMLSEAGALDLMLQIVEAWPTDLDEDLTPLGAVGQILHLAGEIAEHGYTVESAREALVGFGRELEQVGETNDDARRLLRANRRRIAFLDPIAEYQKRKRDMGVLDFSDQLVLATRIVREAPAVRAALRLQRWDEVARFIGHMPQSLQNDPAWRYWLGRSLAAQGNAAQAQNHYRAAAASGRNFYALLAAEELGQRADARNNVADAQPAQVAAVGKDGAIQRALTLFRSSQQGGNWKMRRQAQNEWRYAVRSFDEPAQLAAAQLAFDNQFYEMAVYSADRTNRLLNYKLRYISPFSDLVRPHAAAVGLDPAWVYGLIRQESRFVIGAQSGVGAQGLMQVMPATAQVIARQTGMSDSELYTMSGNIRMGTWYLSDIRGKLQNSDVLATAGYNAGPGRARKWQAAGSLEGAVYAETIPFNETRDYVKKGMANAVYYAALFGSGNTSLKQRMGRVPGRQ